MRLNPNDGYSEKEASYVFVPSYWLRLNSPVVDMADTGRSVATYATSGALASSRDTLRADSDLRAYGSCHRRDGTAGTPELLPQITQPGLGTISDDYGPAATCRSMDLAAAA